MNNKRTSRSSLGGSMIPSYPIPRDIKNTLKDFESLSKKKPEELSTVTTTYINLFNKLKGQDRIEILENEYKKVLDLGLYIDEYENRVILDQEFSCFGRIKKIEDDSKRIIYRIDLFKEVFSEDEELPPQISNNFKIFQRSNPSNCFELTIMSQFKNYLLATSTDKK